jgi:hypothetical protein
VPSADSQDDALLTVNGRDYRIPRQPTVVITIDGCQPAYLDDGMERGLMPRLKALLDEGGNYHLGNGQMPSLTNPNNVSIVTGVAPAVHGIPGNHFRAPDGSEVQLTDPSHLRAPTILGAMREAGERSRDAEPAARVRAATEAFLGALRQFPNEAQTLLVEIVGAGPRAMARRDRALDSVAQYIDELNRFDFERGAAPRFASPHDAFAIAGAVVELASRQIRTGRPGDIRELEPIVERLAMGLLAGPA